MFETTPLIRYSGGECGSVSACSRFICRTHIPARPLRHADEESLIRREPIERLQILSRGRVFPGHVREQGPADIGHILAQRQFAIDFDVVDNRVLPNTA